MNIDSGGKPPDINLIGEISGLGNRTGDIEMLEGSQINKGVNGKNTNKNTKISGNGSDKTIPNITYKFYYGKNDLGPFHVYIENNSPEFKGKLNAIKVNDTIYIAHPELDNKIKEIDSVGRNRVRINFKDSKSANNLIDSKLLQNYNLEAYIPKFTVLRQGVISGIDTDIDVETLKNKIKQFDSHCSFTVFAVKRITKAIIDNLTKQRKIINTKSVVVTFKSQILPKYAAIGHVRCEVTPYIQRVILCYNCYRYGHTSKQCKSNLRCPKCAAGHSENECNKDSNDIKCLHCNGEHKTNNIKICPEFS